MLLLGTAAGCPAYSVLTHEALIDSAWRDAIRPLLAARFPNLTPAQRKEAHAYAYGGAVIQDMGYYPFGSKFFSDLTHYVRSGDFVEALLRDSQTADEYAFALGAMAHYVADNDGHKLAVNRAVPMLYPKLRKKYGDVVVYDQNPAAHLKTEFGFDVLQVARGHYAPDDYRDRIGFEVAKPLLARAFEETYGLKFDDVFSNSDLAISTYRRSVSSIIPKMTKVAWQIKKDDIEKENPGITRQKFLYHLSRGAYNRQWHTPYRHAGFGTRFLAFVINLIPKIGPFRALAFRTPTRPAEQLFMASFNTAVTDYEALLRRNGAATPPPLRNDNFDTGSVTAPGRYPLADKTYAELLDRLAKKGFTQATPEIRKTLLDYYNDPNAPFATKQNRKKWKKVANEVEELRAANAPAHAADARAK